jgi:EF-hand domain pair
MSAALSLRAVHAPVEISRRLTIRSTLFGMLLPVIVVGVVALGLKVQASEQNRLYDRAFRNLDTDDDRYVSEREFIGTKVDEAKARARRLFKELDTNDDHEISRREYRRMIGIDRTRE